MPTSSTSAGRGPKELTWVRNVDGNPRVRWNRVALFALAVIAVQLLGAGLTRRFSDVPLHAARIVAPACVMLAYLVLAVELQRQKVQLGSWRFRLSLSALLLLMGIACVFFAVVANSSRENQRGDAANQRLVAELEAVLQGGHAYVGYPDGSNITCQATRPSFSDDDLASVIELASHQGTRDCELSALFLGGTAVTDAGLRRLAACRKLTMIEVPSLPLSDETVAVLATRQRLESLLLDERQLTAEQLDCLRQGLPAVRLNGKTWDERDRLSGAASGSGRPSGKVPRSRQ